MADDKGNAFALPSLSSIKESTDQAWSETLKTATEKVTDAVDHSIDAVSSVVRSSTATAQQEAGKAYSQAQDVYGIGKAHWEQTEERLLAKVREGVGYVTEHQNESLVAAVCLAAVLLPGPRNFLYRSTLGKLRSEEAMFKSAQQRAGSLAQRLEGHSEELTKLQERVASAQEEYQRGLRNLRAAASDLQGLSGRVHSSEKNARALVSDLRALPSRAALQLRSDVAQAASMASTQRSAIERLVVRLAKQGV